MDLSELEVMGGLLGESLEVVDGETVDIPVPAFAEIAIEGYLDPSSPTRDGPFAEFFSFHFLREGCDRITASIYWSIFDFE